MSTDGSSPLSWPSLLCSSCAISVLFITIRIGYVLGTNARDKKSQKDLSIAWWACAGVLLLSCLWAVIKFID